MPIPRRLCQRRHKTGPDAALFISIDTQEPCVYAPTQNAQHAMTPTSGALVLCHPFETSRIMHNNICLRVLDLISCASQPGM